MTTIDAQCLVVHLLKADGEAVLPPHWRHGAAGDLTYRFAGSENTYSWESEAVEEMSIQWRALGEPRPEGVEAAATAHERLLDMCHRAGRSGPDAVYHDLDAKDVTALWPDEKVVIIVEDVPKVAGRPLISET